MKTRKLLLSSLLALGLIGTMGFNVANAGDESATHDITGRLEKCRDVSYEGGTDTNGINCEGTLSELSPTFRVTTNNPASQELRLTAQAAGVTAMSVKTGGAVNPEMWLALAGPGGTGPSVTNALGSPTGPDQNPNVIVYASSLGFTRVLPTTGGTVAITAESDRYRVNMERQGETDFTLLASGSPKAETYSQIYDQTGDYVATLTFGFFGTP